MKPNHSGDFSESRIAERHDVDHRICIVAGPGTRIAGNLYNISTHGCGVFTPSIRLIKARDYLVKIRSWNDLTARVVWSKGAFSGLKFTRPLHISIVSEISRRGSPMTCEGRQLHTQLPVDLALLDVSAPDPRPFDPPGLRKA